MNSPLFLSSGFIVIFMGFASQVSGSRGGLGRGFGFGLKFGVSCTGVSGFQLVQGLG